MSVLYESMKVILISHLTYGYLTSFQVVLVGKKSQVTISYLQFIITRILETSVRYF